MISFKQYIIEDIYQMRNPGTRDFYISGVGGRREVHDLGAPVHSMGTYDIHQIHFHDAESSHRGFGVSHELAKKDNRPVEDNNHGTFVLVHRPSEKILGVAEYDHDPSRDKEVKIQNLHGIEGEKGIRSKLYDTIADKLGYTIVSDTTQTAQGRRGWEKDIADGKNITVRYTKRNAKLGKSEIVDEIPADEVDSSHIWTTGHLSKLTHPKTAEEYNADRVMLVRHPAKKR